MRKITNREKALIVFGSIVAISIIVYFLVLPIVRGDQAKSSSSLKVKQEKLKSLERLKSMDQTITELEKQMETQLGYNQVSFDAKTSESTIMTYVAQTMNQSEIREIDQLDIKPEKSKKKQTDQRGDQAILKALVDKLYMAQVTSEKDGTIQLNAKTPPENPNSEDEKGSQDAELTEKDKDIGTNIFPIIPKNIPEKARQSLISFIQDNNGQTLSSDNIDEVLKSSEINDDKEKEQVKKKLVLYSNRVKERKGEVLGLISKLGIVQKASAGDKIGRFNIKIAFKSDISQLVKFLYNLQNTAKWIKIDGMNISVADKQRSLLAVEIAMTASALYK